jgi:hypothetical protein
MGIRTARVTLCECCQSWGEYVRRRAIQPAKLGTAHNESLIDFGRDDSQLWILANHICGVWSRCGLPIAVNPARSLPKAHMIAILAVFFFFAVSAMVVLASIHINRNLLPNGHNTHLNTNDRPAFLIPTLVRRGPGHLARDFLLFREEHETGWEIMEAGMIAAVFVLLFLGFEEEEYLVSLVSHILVGILLVLKFASLGASWWSRYHAPGHGLD